MTSNTTHNTHRPLIFAAAFAAMMLSGIDAANGACPAGTGTPIKIDNMEARETVGHEYVVVRGSVAVGTPGVSLTRIAPGVADERFDWPADSGLFKGVARLRPGLNQLVVAAAGHVPACVDVIFERNPLPLHPLRATLILTADQGEGPGVLMGPPGESTDLESARKRIGFALSLTQTVYGELMHRVTGIHWAPGVKLDAQGYPEVKVFRSKWTRDQLRGMGGNGAWAIDSVQREMGALLGGSDLHAVFLLFHDGYAWNAPTGPWFAASKELSSWPRGLEELATRLTDRSPTGCNCGIGTIPTSTRRGEYYATFGQWLFLSAQQIRAYPNGGSSSPLATLYQGLQLFMLRDIHTDAAKNNRLVNREDVFINGGSTAAAEFLATGQFEKSMATYPARAATGLAPGLSVAYHEGTYQALPDFKAKPIAELTTSNVVLPMTARREMFALRYTGWIKAPKSGAYRFHLNSDDGSRLYLDDSLIVDNDGAHEARVRLGVVGLAEGYHAFRLDYFNRIGTGVLDLKWESTESAPTVVPETALFRAPPPASLPRLTHAAAPILRRSGNTVLYVRADGPMAQPRAYSPSGRRVGDLP